LRRARLAGRFGADEAELRSSVRAGELVIDARPDADGIAVGPLRYRRLPDGAWSIFSNVVEALGTETNVDAEARVRGAIRDEDLALHDRLVFDSEPGALAIIAASEDDIRRAARVIAVLAGK
jgi:hypothetical protein